MAKAIDSIWKLRIVHRDIKPSNIMRKTSGRYCLIDLGVARHIDRTPLTNLGSTWGTVGYLSPEQCRFQRQLTCKSDIFSLAVVLTESALGKHPTNRNQEKLLLLDPKNINSPHLKSWDKFELLVMMYSKFPFARPTPKTIIENYYGE